MPIFKTPKVKISAVEVVDISLVLNTVLAAGIGDEKFRKRMSEKITYLQQQYKDQVPVDQQAAIAKKILKRYKINPNKVING